MVLNFPGSARFVLRHEVGLGFFSPSSTERLFYLPQKCLGADHSCRNYKKVVTLEISLCLNYSLSAMHA